MITQLLDRWHDLASKNIRVLNLLLLVFSAVLAADLARLTVDPDWLNLFDTNDPMVQRYKHLGAEASNTHTLYVRMMAMDPEVFLTLSSAIRDIRGVASVAPLSELGETGRHDWVTVAIRKDLGFSQEQRWVLMDEVRAICKQHDPSAGITGAEAILQEFTDSVNRDFIRTSVLALLLVGFVVFAFLGFTRCVALGFAYQMAGLLLGLVLYRHIYGSLNMLSAALPCVLIGLGIDYVVHSLTVVQFSDLNDRAGIDVYRKVAWPMFWGATTTALAFLSLTLADLPGLRPIGIMGCLGILCMFSMVFLFLPPAISRSCALDGTPFKGPRSRKGFEESLLPATTKGRGSAAVVVFVTCAGLSAFAFRTHMEGNLENLYDPNMDSLVLQTELTQQVGVYPSVLSASFLADEPQPILTALSGSAADFLVNPSTARVQTGDENLRTEVSVQLMARFNPFDPTNMQILTERLRQHLQSVGASEVVLTGDAVLSQHMNDLLVWGMMMAFVAVFGLLILVLTIMFRKPLYVAIPLFVLTLSIAATLGGINIMGVNLSAYNLTLFPLFVGIGVDDCLYVAHTIRKGRSLSSSPHVTRGIALTTVTTLLGYGSLLAASNPGFVAMGKTACTGLALTLLCAVYLLPVLLSRRSNRTPE